MNNITYSKAGHQIRLQYITSDFVKVFDSRSDCAKTFDGATAMRLAADLMRDGYTANMIVGAS